MIKKLSCSIFAECEGKIWRNSWRVQVCDPSDAWRLQQLVNGDTQQLAHSETTNDNKSNVG